MEGQQPAAAPDSATAADARNRIERALEVLGGEARVRAIATIEIQGTGVEFRAAEIQGWKPGSRTRSEHRETVVADFPNARVSHEYRTGRHDGSTRWRRFMYAGEQRAWIEFTNRIADRAPHPRAAEDRRELLRRIPHYLLLEAWDHPEGLRTLPDTTAGGRRLHVVSYAIPGRKETVRLLLDAETSLLAAVTQPVDFLGVGDAVVEIAYDTHTRHDALGWFPGGHELRLSGAVSQQVRYTRVAVNDAASPGAFDVPEEMRGFTAARDSARAIAPGVYVYTSPQGFNALFVEFSDQVLAVEAPGRSARSARSPSTPRPAALRSPRRSSSGSARRSPASPSRTSRSRTTIATTRAARGRSSPRAPRCSPRRARARSSRGSPAHPRPWCRTVFPGRAAHSG